MNNDRTSVEYWKRHFATRHAMASPTTAVASSWKKYIAKRETRRNEHCRKLGTKRADKPGACWSGTAAVRDKVLAKYTREQSEDKAFSKAAETAAQMSELNCIRNRTEWLDALDSYVACCERLEQRLAALPAGSVTTYAREK